MKKMIMMMIVVLAVLCVRTSFTWAATPSNASSSRSGRGGRGADVVVSEMAESSENDSSTAGGEVHITVDGGEKRYDGTPVTASVTATGLPDGYSLSYNLTGASRTEVGEQDINIHDLRVMDANGNDVTERFALNVDLGTIRIWDDPVAPTSPEVTEPETQPVEPETTPETQPETKPVTEPETTPETKPETVTETTPAETIPETIPETLSPDNPDGPVVNDRHGSHGSDSDSDDGFDPTPTTAPEFHTPDLVEPLPNPDPDPDPVPPTEEETHEVHQMPKMGDASYQEAVTARSIAAALLGIAGLAGIMALLWGRRFFR